MNVKKFNKTAAPRLIRHCIRTKDKYGHYYERTNPDINFEKSHLNYCIEGNIDDVGMFDRKIKEYTDKYKVRNKTTVILASWVIQKPDFYTGDTDEFFRVVFKILKKKYPCYIDGFCHFDESTPHMHFVFCPVKDGQFNAKGVLTKKELEEMHLWMEREIEKEMGYHIAIMKDETRQRAEIVEKFGKLPGFFEVDEEPKYVSMKELKARTHMAIWNEYEKEQERLDYFKQEVDNYKKENNLDEIIKNKKEMVPRKDVERMMQEFMDMLELDLGKQKVKKYRKIAQKFGFLLDKLADAILK